MKKNKMRVLAWFLTLVFLIGVLSPSPFINASSGGSSAPTGKKRLSITLSSNVMTGHTGYWAWGNQAEIKGKNNPEIHALTRDLYGMYGKGEITLSFWKSDGSKKDLTFSLLMQDPTIQPTGHEEPELRPGEREDLFDITSPLNRLGKTDEDGVSLDGSTQKRFAKEGYNFVYNGQATFQELLKNGFNGPLIKKLYEKQGGLSNLVKGTGFTPLDLSYGQDGDANSLQLVLEAEGIPDESEIVKITAKNETRDFGGFYVRSKFPKGKRDSEGNLLKDADKDIVLQLDIPKLFMYFLFDNEEEYPVKSFTVPAFFAYKIRKDRKPEQDRTGKKLRGERDYIWLNTADDTASRSYQRDKYEDDHIISTRGRFVGFPDATYVNGTIDFLERIDYDYYILPALGEDRERYYKPVPEAEYEVYYTEGITHATNVERDPKEQYKKLSPEESVRGDGLYTTKIHRNLMKPKTPGWEVNVTAERSKLDPSIQNNQIELRLERRDENGAWGDFQKSRQTEFDRLSDVTKTKPTTSRIADGQNKTSFKNIFALRAYGKPFDYRVRITNIPGLTYHAAESDEDAGNYVFRKSNGDVVTARVRKKAATPEEKRRQIQNFEIKFDQVPLVSVSGNFDFSKLPASQRGDKVEVKLYRKEAGESTFTSAGVPTKTVAGGKVSFTALPSKNVENDKAYEYKIVVTKVGRESFDEPEVSADGNTTTIRGRSFGEDFSAKATPQAKVGKDQPYNIALTNVSTFTAKVTSDNDEATAFELQKKNGGSFENITLPSDTKVSKATAYSHGTKLPLYDENGEKISYRVRPADLSGYDKVENVPGTEGVEAGQKVVTFPIKYKKKPVVDIKATLKTSNVLPSETNEKLNMDGVRAKVIRREKNNSSANWEDFTPATEKALTKVGNNDYIREVEFKNLPKKNDDGSKEYEYKVVISKLPLKAGGEFTAETPSSDGNVVVFKQATTGEEITATASPKTVSPSNPDKLEYEILPTNTTKFTAEVTSNNSVLSGFQLQKKVGNGTSFTNISIPSGTKVSSSTPYRHGEKLPVYEGTEKITYKVIPGAIPNHKSQAEVIGTERVESGNKVLTFGMEYENQVVGVTATIDKSKLPDSQKTGEIKVKVFRKESGSSTWTDSGKPEQTVTFTGDKGTATFNELPKKTADGSQGYEYKVVVTKVGGTAVTPSLTGDGNSQTIKNDTTGEKITATTTPGAETDTNRSSEIVLKNTTEFTAKITSNYAKDSKFTLKNESSNSNVVTDGTVKKDAPYTHNVKLPKYDDTGREITYSVLPKEVTGLTTAPKVTGTTTVDPNTKDQVRTFAVEYKTGISTQINTGGFSTADKTGKNIQVDLYKKTPTGWEKVDGKTQNFKVNERGDNPTITSNGLDPNGEYKHVITKIGDSTNPVTPDNNETDDGNDGQGKDNFTTSDKNDYEVTYGTDGITLKNSTKDSYEVKASFASNVTETEKNQITTLTYTLDSVPKSFTKEGSEWKDSFKLTKYNDDGSEKQYAIGGVDLANFKATVTGPVNDGGKKVYTINYARKTDAEISARINTAGLTAEDKAKEYQAKVYYKDGTTWREYKPTEKTKTFNFKSTTQGGLGDNPTVTFDGLEKGYEYKVVLTKIGSGTIADGSVTDTISPYTLKDGADHKDYTVNYAPGGEITVVNTTKVAIVVKGNLPSGNPKNPTEVSYKLSANGTKESATSTVKASESWEKVHANKPMYQNGSPVTYTATDLTGGNGFTAVAVPKPPVYNSANGRYETVVALEYTYTSAATGKTETIDTSGIPNKDKDKTITVELYRKTPSGEWEKVPGTEKTPKIGEGGSVTVDFGNQPDTDPSGNPYTYQTVVTKVGGSTNPVTPDKDGTDSTTGNDADGKDKFKDGNDDYEVTYEAGKIKVENVTKGNIVVKVTMPVGNTKNPTSISYKLKEGSTVGAEETLSSANGWTKTYENKPLYKAGKPIVYGVSEYTEENGFTGTPIVDGPKVVDSKYKTEITLAYSYTSLGERVTQEVDISELPNKDKDKEITTELYRKTPTGGWEKVPNSERTGNRSGNTVSFDFGEQPKTDDQGNDYEYKTVITKVGGSTEAVTVDGGSSDDTNDGGGKDKFKDGNDDYEVTYGAGKKISLSNVTKGDIVIQTTFPAGNKLIPTEISYKLSEDGVVESTESKVTKDTWKKVHPDKPLYKNGNEVSYSVAEVTKPEGFTPVVKVKPPRHNGSKYETVVEINFTYGSVNTPQTKTIDTSGIPAKDKDKEITVEIYRKTPDGNWEKVPVPAQKVKVGDGGSVEVNFGDLPKTDENGNPYTYQTVVTKIGDSTNPVTPDNDEDDSTTGNDADGKDKFKDGNDDYEVTYGDDGSVKISNVTKTTIVVKGQWTGGTTKIPSEVSYNLSENGVKETTRSALAPATGQNEHADKPMYKNGNLIPYTTVDMTAVPGFTAVATPVDPVYNDVTGRYETVVTLGYTYASATTGKVETIDTKGIPEADKDKTITAKQYRKTPGGDWVEVPNSEITGTIGTDGKVDLDFGDLPETDEDGNPYTYQTVVTKIGDSTETVTPDTDEDDKDDENDADGKDKFKDGDSDYEVTYENGKITVNNVTKKDLSVKVNWIGGSDEKKPKTATYYLVTNGTPAGEVTKLGEENGGSWENSHSVLKYNKENGKENEYGINANDPENYKATVEPIEDASGVITGFTITYTYQTDKTGTYTARKIWNNGDRAVREVKLTLQRAFKTADGSEPEETAWETLDVTPTITLDSTDSKVQNYVWNGLEKSDIDLKEYVYRAVEEEENTPQFYIPTQKMENGVQEITNNYIRLKVTATTDKPHYKKGDTVTVTVTVENVGEVDLTDAVAELVGDSAEVLTSETTETALAKGEKKTYTYTYTIPDDATEMTTTKDFKASAKFGEKLITGIGKTNIHVFDKDNFIKVIGRIFRTEKLVEKAEDLKNIPELTEEEKTEIKNQTPEEVDFSKDQTVDLQSFDLRLNKLSEVVAEQIKTVEARLTEIAEKIKLIEQKLSNFKENGKLLPKAEDGKTPNGDPKNPEEAPKEPKDGQTGEVPKEPQDGQTGEAPKAPQDGQAGDSQTSPKAGTGEGTNPGDTPNAPQDGQTGTPEQAGDSQTSPNTGTGEGTNVPNVNNQTDEGTTIQPAPADGSRPTGKNVRVQPKRPIYFSEGSADAGEGKVNVPEGVEITNQTSEVLNTEIVENKTETSKEGEGADQVLRVSTPPVETVEGLEKELASLELEKAELESKMTTLKGIETGLTLADGFGFYIPLNSLEAGQYIFKVVLGAALSDPKVEEKTSYKRDGDYVDTTKEVIKDFGYSTNEDFEVVVDAEKNITSNRFLYLDKIIARYYHVNRVYDPETTPIIPEPPSTSDTPDKPKTPDIPDTSDKPKSPDTPIVPEVPKTPDVPSIPGIPSVPSDTEDDGILDDYDTPGDIVPPKATVDEPNIEVFDPNDSLPDPNAIDSPDTLMLIDEDGVPLGVYKKKVNKNGEAVYVDEDGVPLGKTKVAQTSDDFNGMLWWGLLLSFVGIAFVLRRWKKKA